MANNATLNPNAEILSSGQRGFIGRIQAPVAIDGSGFLYPPIKPYVTFPIIRLTVNTSNIGHHRNKARVWISDRAKQRHDPKRFIPDAIILR